MTRKRSFLSTLVFFLCCWYLLLCAVHYTRQRPLWLDEESVFKSVAYFQPQDFFSKKLAINQIFPRFHLYLIHNISKPFDFDLLSLRFLSLAAMVGAFFIWLKIASYELKDRWQYLTFVLCWPASALLVYYSAELKPYSMDVLAASIFMLFLYHQKRLAEQKNKAPYLACLFLLPLLGLFSYPVFLFFIFPVFNILMEKEKKPWHWAGLAAFCVSALLAVSYLYFFDLRITKATVHSQGFLEYSVSYGSVGEFFKTWGEGTKNLFVRWFAERPRLIKKIALFFTAFGLFYMFYGFFRNIKKSKDYLFSVDVLALLLYIELFILGSLGKYPFSVPRTSLFFCPFILIMTIKGIAELWRLHPILFRAVHVLYLIFLTAVAVGISRVVLTQDFSFASQVW